MSKVLVSGLNGFTGKHLKFDLESNGFEVHGLTDDQNLEIDLGDLDRLKSRFMNLRPEYVIHLAGIAFVGHSDALEFYKTNVLGTENLLRACVESKSGSGKVILASSANVYGANPNSPLDESVTPAPVNHYAISKLAMECVAQTFSNSLPILLARPFNYTGAGQSENFVIPKIVAHFKNRSTKILLGNRSVRREYNDVRLVAKMYSALLKSNLSNETVNLCTGRAYSLDDIFQILETITSHSMSIETDPQLVRKNEIHELFGNPARISNLVDIAQFGDIRSMLEWMLRA